MPSKEQVVDLVEILAFGSITAVGLALGGPVGEHIMAGLGMHLLGNITHARMSRAKEQWLINSSGVMNHDIQQALMRSYLHALDYLERKYLDIIRPEQTFREEKERVHRFFAILRKRSEQSFMPSLKKAASTITEQEIKHYLYDKPNVASEMIWKRIDGATLLQSYEPRFRNFLRESILPAIQFWFGEELKTDNLECNKAWRAFQRLLIEGIEADVKAVRASQDLILHDLQIIVELKSQFESIKDCIDHRVPNELFQKSLEEITQQVRLFLEESFSKMEKKMDEGFKGISDHLHRIDAHVKSVGSDVKSLVHADRPAPVGMEEDIQAHLSIFRNYCKDTISELGAKRGVSDYIPLGTVVNGTDQDVDIPAFVGRCKKMVIIGDPGAGKTTLVMKELMLVFAKRRLSEDRGPIPVYIELREDTRKFGLETIEKALDRYSVSKETVKNFLRKNCFLLIFDGLDRLKGNRPLLDFVELPLVRGNLVVITCRKGNFRVSRELDFCPEFGVVEVCKLSEDQVRQYLISKLAIHDGSVFGNMDEKLRDLLRNPLLLWLYTQIVKELAQGERHANVLEQSDLYNNFVNKMFSIHGEEFNEDTLLKKEALAELAFCMNETGQLYYPIERALESLKKAVDRLNKDRISPLELSAFFQEVKVKGILVPERYQGKDEVGFLHQTFQEFFGRYYLGRHPELAKRINRDSPLWEEFVGSTPVTPDVVATGVNKSTSLAGFVKSLSGILEAVPFDWIETVFKMFSQKDETWLMGILVFCAQTPESKSKAIEAIKTIREEKPFLLVDTLNRFVASYREMEISPLFIWELINSQETTDDRTYYHQGNTFYEKGSYEDAIIHYSAAVTINPFLSEAYYNRGLCYYNLKDFDLAIEDYTIAGELDRKNPVIYNSLGDAHYRKQRFVDSVKFYNLAIAINRKYLKAYYNRGLAYACIQAYGLSIADFGEVIALNPNFAEAYHIRGLAHDYLGDLDKAIQDYDRALELNPDFDEARHHREVAIGKRGTHEAQRSVIADQSCKYTSNEHLVDWLSLKDNESFVTIEHVVDCAICKKRIAEDEKLRELYKCFTKEMNWTLEKGAINKDDNFHGECGFVTRCLATHPEKFVRGTNHSNRKVVGRINRHAAVCTACKTMLVREEIKVGIDEMLAIHLQNLSIGADGSREIVDKLSRTISDNPDMIIPYVMDAIRKTKQAIVKRLGVSINDSEGFPKLIETYLNISSFSYDSIVQACTRMNATHKYEKSISILTSLILMKPDLGDIYVLRGAAYSKVRKYFQAFKDFSTALTLDKKEEAHLHLGDLFFDKGDYNEAIDQYDGALSINSDCKEAYERRGNAYLELKDYEKAIEDYEGAMTKGDVSSEVYHMRGLAYGYLGFYDRAFADYDKSFTIDPSLYPDKRYADVYNFRGNTYFENELFDEAIRDYDKAIELDPKHPSCYANRAGAYSAKGLHDKAIADLTYAVQINPADPSSYVARGDAEYNTGLYETAATDYTIAIQLDSKNAYAFNSRGNAYSCMGQDDKALFDYEESIKLQPDAIVCCNKGGIFLGKGDYARATEEYARAIDLDPLCGYAFGQLALTYFMQGKLRDALSQINKALHMDDKTESYASFIYTKILICKELKDKASLEESFGLIEKYVGELKSSEPRYSSTCAVLSNIYCELSRKIDVACSFAERALRISPDFFSHFALGFCCFRNGQVQEALAHLETSLRLNPSYLWCRLRFGQVLNDIGERDKAIQIWKEGLLINPNNRLIIAELEESRAS